MTIQRPRLRLAVSALAAAILFASAPDLLAQRGAQGGRPGGGGGSSASRGSSSAGRPSAPAARPSAPAARPSAPASRPSAPSARPSAPSAAPSRGVPSSRGSAPSSIPSSSAARASGSSLPSRTTSYSAPAPLRNAPAASNPSPTRSAVPSSQPDRGRSAGGDSGYPALERAPRVRFPAPASGSGSSRSSARETLSSTAGPSASRMRTSASAGSRGAAPARERVSIADQRAGESGRALAPSDREAILDRYRRVSPSSARSSGPSARLEAASLGRSASAGSGNLSERAALARSKNSRAAAARASLSKVAGAEQAEAGTRRLRELAAKDPAAAARYQRAGEAVTRVAGAGVSVGVAVGLGCWYGGWYDDCYPYGWCDPWYGSSWSFWWGWGCYPYSWFAHPFAPCYWYWWGYWPYGINYWYPGSYSSYYSPPVYYSTVIYETAEPAQVVEEAPADYVGEGVVEPREQARLDGLLRTGPDSAARASGQYLTLGDRAFREGRYADAVHFYARAVEFAPDEAVLYLVLSDGLFATGDYHYGAFALRKALELDPTLVTSGIDKHTFYVDPKEFEAQLAQLESYLVDRPGDDDARLMLAANYLFGNRAAAAVDLLGEPASDRLLDDAAAALILQAARDAQYGVPAGR
jgi:hypothetical protein